MPIAAVSGHSWPIVPPLDLPLTLRLENGRFGALRPKPLDAPPPCTTGQVIPADDPRNPTEADVPFINQIHEAVDLAATVGDCVFAAYSGRVVEVEANPAADRGNVTIDHHPQGLGFLTKYNHITDIAVAAGEFVQKGTPFAAVSSEPAEPHLHFELWVVVDRAGASDGPPWPGDTRPRPHRPDAHPLRLGDAHARRTRSSRAARRRPRRWAWCACTRCRSSPRRSRAPCSTSRCTSR